VSNRKEIEELERKVAFLGDEAITPREWVPGSRLSIKPGIDALGSYVWIATVKCNGKKVSAAAKWSAMTAAKEAMAKMREYLKVHDGIEDA